MAKVSKKADLISVVVPIYNVESYLGRCIDSILNQSYKNLEIILVDDGSPDGCSKICDDYSKKDERIKVYHKKNGGLSDARNYGISKSNGKLITFIDSDDYIEEDYIQYLYNLKKTFNTKISVCGHYTCYSNKKIKKTSSSTSVVDKISALKYILYDKEIDICSWGKLYDIDLFEKIKFPTGKIFEDTATTYLLFDDCDFIAIGNECKYNYVMREDSITTKDFNLKKMQLIEMTINMCDYIKKKYPVLENGCNRRLMWAYMSTYTKIVYTSIDKYTEYKKEIKKYIKEHSKDILKDKEISNRDKVSLKIFSLGDNLFKFSWSLYKKIFN